LIVFAAVLWTLFLGAADTLAQSRSGTTFADRIQDQRRPRLTVVISIDQFRADYLRRFSDLYLPPRQKNGRVGGFRYLMNQGAYFIDARYNHYPTFTGPGHAVILTGGHPYKTGIVGNDWFDKSLRSTVSCVPRHSAMNSSLRPAARQRL
jgi:predicted AlkP superfamily pyrophosphatase or phosphodiesterase